MARRTSIGRAELVVLQYVQDHQPVTVRQVAEHMARAQGVVRTTVLNVMARLLTKGYLVRKKEQGVWHYSPRQTKARLLRTMVRDFVDRVLGGSISPFMMYLTEDATLSPDEIKQLKQIVLTLDPKGTGLSENKIVLNEKEKT